MPTRKLDYLEKGDKRLQLKWKGRYKDFAVTLDEKNGGQVDNLREQNLSFETAEGYKLAFFMDKTGLFGAEELHGTINSEPIPNTAADPYLTINGGRQILYFFGGIQLLIGAAFYFFGQDSELAAFSWIALDGVILLGMALISLLGGTMSIIAFGAAILYYIAGFFVLATSGTNPSSGIVVRVFVVLYLWRAIQGVRKLENMPDYKAKRA